MTPADILALRTRLKLNQTQFAALLGANSQATVSQWENGLRKPDRWFTHQLTQLWEKSNHDSGEGKQ